MTIYFSKVDFFVRQKVKKAIANAQKILNIPQNCEFNLSFVTVSEITYLNCQQRDIDKPTDVLSFPNIDGLNKKQICLNDFVTDINPDSGNLMLGDIIICKAIAKTQAKQIGHSTLKELVFLTVHGFLHLLGYDHMTDSDQQQMTALQRKILNL